jgi:hypothetical protein
MNIFYFLQLPNLRWISCAGSIKRNEIRNNSNFIYTKTTFALLLAKKSFISSLLLCVFAIVFVHSIIPHHHHEEVTTEQGSNHHDDDHNDLDNNFLGEAFSHFQHDAGSTILYETPSPSFQCSKFSIDQDVFLLTCYVVRQFYKPPLISIEPSSIIFLSSILSAVHLFRGPPVA